MLIDFAKLNRLPSIPVVATRLLETYSNPEVTLNEIAEVVESDPAITLKILRAASSSHFGSGRPVTDLRRAINLLGRTRVSSLALCFSLSDDSIRTGPFARLYDAQWLRSILQATVARMLSPRITCLPESELFTAGLIADIGSLAMLKSAPQEYASFLDEEERRSNDSDPSAQPLANACDKLSIAIMEHSKLASRFMDAVRCRECSLEELMSQPASESRELNLALAFATAVSRYALSRRKVGAFLRTLEIWTEFYKRPEADIDAFLEAVRLVMADTANLFDTHISRLGSPAEIMSDAMQQLSRLVIAGADSAAPGADGSQLVDENGELKRRVQDLVRRAQIDGLTQIFNRSHFDQVLAERLAVAAMSRRPMGLLFIDVDHFKQFNDRHGHAVGDQVLKEIARALSQSARTNDFVARYGGEEFVVLPAEPTTEALQALGERLRSAVECLVMQSGDTSLHVTISVGGAMIEPPFEGGSVRLVSEADAAVYAAKANGRNRVEMRMSA